MTPVGFLKMTFVPFFTPLKSGFHVRLDVALMRVFPPIEVAGRATRATHASARTAIIRVWMRIGSPFLTRSFEHGTRPQHRQRGSTVRPRKGLGKSDRAARAAHTPQPGRAKRGPRKGKSGRLWRSCDGAGRKTGGWELDVDEVIEQAERRLADEQTRARKRALQLAREQGYHRLALEIDRPARTKVSPSQLSFFPEPTLFDQE